LPAIFLDARDFLVSHRPLDSKAGLAPAAPQGVAGAS
jgi:hypothetical protein